MSLFDGGGGGVGGDIWSTTAFAFDSPLKDLLDSENYTLEQLLEEDELLQELRSMHPRLVSYFSNPETVERLIRMMLLEDNNDPNSKSKASGPASSSDDAMEIAAVDESMETIMDANSDHKASDDDDEEAEETPKPGDWLYKQGNLSVQQQEEAVAAALPQSLSKTHADVDEMRCVRYPYMACEVICCELNGVLDALVDVNAPTNDEKNTYTAEGSDTSCLLDLLFSILTVTPVGTLDDRRAGYLEKIITVLFRRRPMAMTLYLNNPNAGPSLMLAFFRQLHSHSIMQIVQRLLLPPPPSNNNNNMVHILDEDNNTNSNGMTNGGLITAGTGSWGTDPFNENEDDGYDEDGNFEGMIRCNWTERPEAIHMLLSRMAGEAKIVIRKGDSKEDEEEAILNSSMHASEVLITIVQNSPLTSPILVTLTTDPALDQIIRAATTLKDKAEFSMHESILTCAILVLESIILNLGGFGAVASGVEPENEEYAAVAAAVEAATSATSSGNANSDPASTTTAQNDGTNENDNGAFSIATTRRPSNFARGDSLIPHLPHLLSSLSNLLKHPSTNLWKSPTQYQKSHEPVQLLGTSRLRIVRLLESLVLLGDAQVDTHLCQSDCLEQCLDLFWQFQWCSMLHQSVANLLVHIFEGANNRSTLQEYVIVRCNLLGRLMNSFEETSITRTSMSNSLSKDSEKNTLEQALSPVALDNDDAIPVSDDDVDAAMEQQKDLGSSTSDDVVVASLTSDDEDMPDASSEPVESLKTVTATIEPSNRTFRMGYMGHVIIICQALVHASGASSNNNEDQEMEVYSSNIMNGNDLELRVQQEKRRLDKDIDQEQVTKKRKDRSTMSRSNEDDSGNDDNGPLDTPLPPSPPTEPSTGALLKITRLIQDHQLHSRWQAFITNTLASETAVQSTPLGGYNNAQSDGSQSGQSHRPSLLEPGDFSLAASSAVGGLIVGGDVIDMDDADLDIAASMMEALSLPPAGATTGDGDIRAGESGAPNRRHHRSGSYNSTESSSSGDGRFGTVIEQPTTSNASDYFYHDPLGRGRQFDDDDDSDEELETPTNDDEEKESGSIFDVVNMHSSDSDSDGKDGSGEEDDDVPVMDLFAGNFSFGDQTNTEGKTGGSNASATAGAIPVDSDGAWSNFANFDDAFASSAFPEPSPIGPTETGISVSPPDVSLFESVNTTDMISSDNAKSIENKPSEDLFNSIGGDTSKQDPFSVSPEVANALVNTLGDDTNETMVTKGADKKEQEAPTER